MSADSHYNAQFIQFDFRLLDNPEFLQFVTRTEFATYLILRRYIWRGGRHRLGLHDLYANEHKLASSIGTKRIAELLGLKDATRVSKHLTYLESQGAIRRIPTGRETIFVLGEWHQPPGWNVSKEFYYLDNRFGVAFEGPQSPIAAKNPGSDLAQKAKPDLHSEPDQTWLEKPSSNRKGNREDNTVNGIKNLPDLGLSPAERDYIAGEILAELKDRQSQRFYQLVAAKIPEPFIRQALAEIRADGAREPAKVFTYRMNRYAYERQTRG